MSGRAVQAWIESARGQFAANPRLRWGGLAIAAILVLYVWLLLSDWQAALARDYRQERQRLEKILSLAGQGHWLARAEAAGELRRVLEAEIPVIQTLGLAQASVQSWARDLSVAFGDGFRIQAGEATRAAAGEDLWRVPVTLSGSLDPRQAVQLMQRIESQANLATIEQALILNRSNRTFSLTVVVFYRIPQGGDDARA